LRTKARSVAGKFCVCVTDREELSAVERWILEQDSGAKVDLERNPITLWLETTLTVDDLTRHSGIETVIESQYAQKRNRRHLESVAALAKEPEVERNIDGGSDAEETGSDEGHVDGDNRDDAKGEA